MIFLPIGLGTFLEPKIGSERVPEMGPALQREQHFEEPRRIGVSKTHIKIKIPGILGVKNQYAGGGRLFSARTQWGRNGASAAAGATL